MQGAWVDPEAISIAYRELYAITAATFTWGHTWGGKRIVFLTDNKTITKIWDKGTSPTKAIMDLIRPLYLFAAQTGFSISFKHIYGVYNLAADALSRFQMDIFRAAKPDSDQCPTPIPDFFLPLRNNKPSRPSKRKLNS